MFEHLFNIPTQIYAKLTSVDTLLSFTQHSNSELITFLQQLQQQQTPIAAALYC